jgi:predicted amidophosphoribosyltransferase
MPLNQAKICDNCRMDLQRLSSGSVIYLSEFRVYVGFRYQSIVRAMVLRAKVKNEVPAVAALISSLKDLLGDELTRFDEPCCLVIAAPSSFWSRLTGRFDIARLVAATLFPKASTLKGQLPGAFWRQKRAGRNAVLATSTGLRASRSVHKSLKKMMNWQGEFNEYIDIQRKISSASRILVIDDVLTTGLTMGTLFHQLKTLGAHRIEGLVLAAADQG